VNISRSARLLLVMTAQVVLSAVYIGGYFWVLREFMTGHVKVPGDYKELFSGLLGVLTAGVGIILSFWFQRVRSSMDSPPEPPK
jgi:uncharacterized protein YneF (UPF0154 family)